MTLRQILKEPLLHFFLLGAGLFLLFGWLNRGAMDAPDEVVVDQARIDTLVAQFERVWQRSPTAPEIHGLIENWIREEIMYREGVALGLDVNDSIVRRRVAQKMTFIADGVAPEPPSEADLAGWLEENADAYRIEPVYSFRQVYFNPAKHGEDLRARITELAGVSSAPEGDATLLPSELQAVRESEVTRTFGSDFAGALGELPPGEWQGPVDSAYGLHLVQVVEKAPGRPATLNEVSAAVERDWAANRTEEINEAFYQTMRERYTVRMAVNPPGDADRAGSGAK